MQDITERSNSRTWELTVEEDPDTGDCILSFPEDLLAAAGWKEGDQLIWSDIGNGAWSLTKKSV